MLITLLFPCTVVECLLFDRIADIFKHPFDHVQRGFFHIVCQVFRICARIGNELEFVQLLCCILGISAGRPPTCVFVGIVVY